MNQIFKAFNQVTFRQNFELVAATIEGQKMYCILMENSNYLH